MRVELFPFQKRALADIRMKTAEAMGSYHRTHAPQVVSFTAPTGAGKTIIMSALIEAILFGDEQYKFCIVDLDYVMHGSYNWSKNANYNEETLATALDREFVSKFADEFMEIYNEIV